MQLDRDELLMLINCGFKFHQRARHENLSIREDSAGSPLRHFRDFKAAFDSQRGKLSQLMLALDNPNPRYQGWRVLGRLALHLSSVLLFSVLMLCFLFGRKNVWKNADSPSRQEAIEQRGQRLRHRPWIFWTGTLTLFIIVISRTNAELNWRWKPHDNSANVLQAGSLRSTSEGYYFGIKYFSFHYCFFGECADHCCSSKDFLASSAIKTSVRLPCKHWSLCGSHCSASLRHIFNVSRIF